MFSIVPLNHNNKPVGYPDEYCNPKYQKQTHISSLSVTQNLEPIQTNY